MTNWGHIVAGHGRGWVRFITLGTFLVCFLIYEFQAGKKCVAALQAVFESRVFDCAARLKLHVHMCVPRQWLRGSDR
jgi:hypothetical protein